MKKLFISCPMKGRTMENIQKSIEKMHKIAEAIFEQELEVIDTYIKVEDPDELPNPPVWHLGESIKKMAEADYFIGVGYTNYFHGCSIEAEVAKAYGIRHIQVSIEDVMPDAYEIETESWQIEKENNNA